MVPKAMAAVAAAKMAAVAALSAATAILVVMDPPVVRVELWVGLPRS